MTHTQHAQSTQLLPPRVKREFSQHHSRGQGLGLVNDIQKGIRIKKTSGKGCITNPNFMPYNTQMLHVGNIYTHIHHKFMVNVGKYSLHGAFWIREIPQKSTITI